VDSRKNLAENGLLSGHIEIWLLADGSRLEGKLKLALESKLALKSESEL
jgi:hypothetical protein